MNNTYSLLYKSCFLLGAIAATGATLFIAAQFVFAVEGVWNGKASLQTGRSLHTATLMDDGRVLVVGGRTPVADPTTSVEIYDPSTNSWTSAASLSAPRKLHKAVVLNDGRVMVLGGSNALSPNATIATAEIYNPQTNTWSSAGSMSISRRQFGVVVLLDGRVLVTGGFETNFAGSTELVDIYNPQTNSWTAGPSLPENRYGHGAVLLQDGQALVAGGTTWVPGTRGLDTAYLYSTSTNSWVQTGGTLTRPRNTQAITLTDGRVLAFGSNFVESDVYYPDLDIWGRVGDMPEVNVEAKPALVGTGFVLAAGGNDINNQSDGSKATYLFNPDTDSWSQTSDLDTGRKNTTLTRLANGNVLAVGGDTISENMIDSVEEFRLLSGNNLRPVADAGPDLEGGVGEDIALVGSATDDGNPNPPGELSYLWIKVSGPGDVTFDNAVDPETTAQFSEAGTYVLEFEADDSELTDRDELIVTVSDHYRVELKAWIPKQEIVDPLMITPFSIQNTRWLRMGQPLRRCFVQASRRNFFGTTEVQSSAFLGDTHTDYGLVDSDTKDYRVRTWVEFDYDGNTISNFTQGGGFGTTTRTTLIQGTQTQRECVQQAVADFAFLPEAEQTGGNSFTMAVAGFDPLVPRTGADIGELQSIACPAFAPFCRYVVGLTPLTPAINGEIDVQIHRGEIEFDYETDFFPSYGVAVVKNGELQYTNIMNDASCVETLGYDGAANLLVRLQTDALPFRNGGFVDAQTSNRACEPEVFPELVLASKIFLVGSVNALSEQFLLIVGSNLP